MFNKYKYIPNTERTLIFILRYIKQSASQYAFYFLIHIKKGHGVCICTYVRRHVHGIFLERFIRNNISGKYNRKIIWVAASFLYNFSYLFSFAFLPCAIISL